MAGQVQELISAGINPQIVVIDQLLPWLSRWEELKGDPQKTRIAARDCIDSLKHQVAERYGTRVMVLHQLTAEKLSKNHWFKPKMSDSSEVRSIAFWADFALCLGIMCEETKCLWAVADKTRRGTKVSMILQSRGKFCRLERSHDIVEHPHHKGHFCRKGEENEVPPDRRRSRRAQALGGRPSANV